MRAIVFMLAVLFLLTGCSTGKFSLRGGEAKYTMPFWPRSNDGNLEVKLNSVYVGMSKQELYQEFADFKQKDYQRNGNQEWVTFYAHNEQDEIEEIRFHLVDGKLQEWKGSNN